MDNILPVIQKMILENPSIIILKLTPDQARDLHAWLVKYHKNFIVDFTEWLGKMPVFLGRKIEIYDAIEKDA